MTDDARRAAYFWVIDWLLAQVTAQEDDPEVVTELTVGVELGGFDIEAMFHAAANLARIFLGRYAAQAGASPEAVLNGLRVDLEKRWP